MPQRHVEDVVFSAPVLRSNIGEVLAEGRG